MSESASTRPVTVRRLTRHPDGRPVLGEPAADVVAAEEPLEIRVEGRSVAVVMRTPGNDRELAAGFLLSEGVIACRSDVFEISLCPSVAGDSPVGGGSVDVLLTRSGGVDFEALTRHVFTSSSCGICGRTGIDSALDRFPPLNPADGPAIDGDTLFPLPDALRAAQPAFAATGGIHACATFDTAGRMLALFEDAGRHNALDKLNGHALLTADQPPPDRILLLSGRVSFELVQKALAARIPVVAAVGAPSSLAVEFAEAAGITLCGFLRNGRANLYSHPRRIRTTSPT